MRATIFEKRAERGERETRGGGRGKDIIDVPQAESLTISTEVPTVPATTVSTAPASVDQFMHTPRFKRHFVEYVIVETLVVLRLTSKPWMREIENFLRRIVANSGQRGELIAHGGHDLTQEEGNTRMERR